MTARCYDKAPLPLASWRSGGLPFVLVGHRGAAGLAPENTMPAFELAHALGADAIELDVHLSHDGVPVVIHDDSVDRTTDGQGPVGDLTVEQLSQLNASRTFGEAFPITRIPTLDTVLEWARHRCHVIIELKGTENPALIRRTIEAVRKHELDHRVLLMSFDHGAVKQAREIGEPIPVGILYATPPGDAIAQAIAVGADVICPHWSLATSAVVSAAHEASLAVSVWTTNDEHAIDAALAAGVDAVTSDFPDRVRVIALPVR